MSTRINREKNLYFFRYRIIGALKKFTKWPVLYLGLKLTIHVNKSQIHSRETVPLRENPNLPGSETSLGIHIAIIRIGLVFYQHRDLHYPDHGSAAYCRKLEIRQQQTYRHAASGQRKVSIRIYFSISIPFFYSGIAANPRPFQCRSGTVFDHFLCLSDPTPDPELKFFFFKAYKETPRNFLTTESFI
jgi:hypothetical protein